MDSCPSFPYCAQCAKASVTRDWPRYTSGCLRCTARDIAQGPQFHLSRKLNRILPAYRAILRANWGSDWQTGHKLVKEMAHANEQIPQRQGDRRRHRVRLEARSQSLVRTAAAATRR